MRQSVLNLQLILIISIYFFSEILGFLGPLLELTTGSPCNSRILGEMKIRELQNREFQGPQHLGIDVS